jgi:ribulose-5-phosphate 4-epimerase/fuculose-1-phosphate aldolase
VSALDPELVEKLVLANHILYRHGVLDAWGHISVRDPVDPSRFWMTCDRAPALVTAEDIIEYDADSEPIDAGGRRVFLERFIHGEAYRARPDVNAVIHSHSPEIIAFGVSETPLRPITQVAGFLEDGAPVFDLHEVDPTPNLLIVNREQAAAVAERLGAAAIVLLRGHGEVTVASSVELLVWRAYYANLNARQLRQALSLGPVRYLTPEEARFASENVPPGKGMQRIWGLWCHELRTR